jgi:hypothetical protein
MSFLAGVLLWMFVDYTHILPLASWRPKASLSQDLFFQKGNSCLLPYVMFLTILFPCLSPNKDKLCSTPSCNFQDSAAQMSRTVLSHIFNLKSVSHLSKKNLVTFFFFFAVLGLELRTYTLSHSTSPFLWWIFQDRVSWTILPRLALNLDPPDRCLLSS